MSTEFERTEYQLETKLTIIEMQVRYHLMTTGQPVECDRVQKSYDGNLYTTDEDGTPHDVRREERHSNGYQNGLNINDTRQLGAHDFMGLMKILATMHEAIERI